jgi:hypothetical protein
VIFFSIIIAVGLFSLGRVIIGRIAPLESNPWLYKALTVCLVLHLLGAPLQIWVVDHLYGGIADYNRYDAQGAALAEGYRHLNFSMARGSQGIVSDGSVSIVAGVVFAIIGVNQLGAFLVFSWLSFIGIVFFYLAFTTTFGRAGSRRYGYAVFFLPTLIFWTSDVSKEAMMTFLMGLTAYGGARILAHRGGYWMVVLGSAGGVFIRPNEVLLVLGGFTLAMLFRPADPDTKLAGPRRTVALIVLGSMLGVAVFVTLHFLPGVTGSISLTQISKNNNSAAGTAGFTSSNLGYSPSVLAYPKDVYSVLFDPLPINAHGGGQWITAVENSVLIWLILTSLRQLRILPRVALARTYVTMCLFFTASFLYAFAALGNLGLITRERTVMLPFLLVILCIPHGPRHRPPRYEWELPRRARIERRKALALRPRTARRRRAAPS